MTLAWMVSGQPSRHSDEDHHRDDLMKAAMHGDDDECMVLLGGERGETRKSAGWQIRGWWEVVNAVCFSSPLPKLSLPTNNFNIRRRQRNILSQRPDSHTRPAQ